MENEGHELWLKCMAGNANAWKVMKRYNIQDVRVTEKLYDKLRPGAQWPRGIRARGGVRPRGDWLPNVG